MEGSILERDNSGVVATGGADGTRGAGGDTPAVAFKKKPAFKKSAFRKRPGGAAGGAKGARCSNLISKIGHHRPTLTLGHAGCSSG